MSKVKKNSDFESNQEFRLKSLTGRVNQELLTLYQIHWKTFPTLRDGTLAGYMTCLPYYISVSEYHHEMSLFNIMLVDAGGLNYEWGKELQDVSPLSLMKLYADNKGNHNPHFMDFYSKFNAIIYNELADAVYVIPNVLKKVPRRFSDDYTPIYNHMVSKGSNLLRTEIRILEPDAVVLMGQSTRNDSILEDIFGKYSNISVSGIERVYRLVREDSDLPIIQIPNPLFLSLTEQTEPILAYLKEFILDQMRLRLSV